jgi:hypothetical protein
MFRSNHWEPDNPADWGDQALEQSLTKKTLIFTKKKNFFFYWSLQLNFSYKQQLRKIPLIILDKLHVMLIANEKRYWIKKNSTNISSSFDSIVYVLSHATKM